MLRIKKKDLVQVIRNLQADIKDKLVAARTTPKDEPWLDSVAWVEAEKFLDELEGGRVWRVFNKR